MYWAQWVAVGAVLALATIFVYRLRMALRRVLSTVRREGREVRDRIAVASDTASEVLLTTDDIQRRLARLEIRISEQFATVHTAERALAWEVERITRDLEQSAVAIRETANAVATVEKRLQREDLAAAAAVREIGRILDDVADEAKVTRERVASVHLDLHRLRVAAERLPAETVSLQQASQIFGNGRLGIPELGGWAISSGPLVEVLRYGKDLNSPVILETGSGSSTVWLGWLIERNGGALFSLEHDSSFVNRTRSLLRRGGIEGSAVKLLDAPLRWWTVDGDRYRWYALDGLPVDVSLDVVLVDGPPEASGDHARYPALPLLLSRLAPVSYWMLDDTVRETEQNILERWIELGRRTRAFAIEEVCVIGKATSFVVRLPPARLTNES